MPRRKIRIEKRAVTMRAVTATIREDGAIETHETTAVDYVPLDILDAYVADAQTRWQSIYVGDTHDPGPAGDDGPTFYPEHLSQGHPHCGRIVDRLGKVIKEV